MKRLLIILIAALAAVSVYAMTATGGQQAVTPKQFNALKATVSKQGKTIKALEACLLVRAVGLTQFGTGADEGYVYKPTGSNDLVLTSAIDFPAQGQQPQFWVITTTPQCASAINSKAGPLPRLARQTETR